MAATCPTCGAPRQAADRFCEACGARLVAESRWISSAADVTAPCVTCGSADINDDGYCDNCGRRRDAGRDKAELVLAHVAAVTDRGLRRARNEDVVAVGELDTAAVAVVCDGVSTSTHSDDAARAGAQTGVETLLTELDGGASAERATEAAGDAALAAVAALSGPRTLLSPPSCTYVSAVVTAGGLTVGWVGDSRAYWVPADGPAVCLTEDDSLAVELAARGADVTGPPHASPLTRWLGADAGPVHARVRTLDDPGPGRLVICSDGLSRYLSGPDDLAPDAVYEPVVAARRLTWLALHTGGVDNISVAVLPYPLDGGPE